MSVQLILCRSEAECERAASLFPRFECRYTNGGADWTEIEGRKVVSLGIELAHMAIGYAAEVKVIEAEFPPDLTPAGAIAWAKQNAVTYNANPSTQDSAAGNSSPLEAETAPQGVKAGAGAINSPAPLPPAPLDTVEAAQEATEPHPPPDLDPPAEWLQHHDNAPEAHSEGWQTPASDFGIPENLWGHEDSLPVLPPECYPNAIAAYVIDEAETMGCDPGMLALYCIAVCAGATTDEIRLQVKAASDRWQEPARVWMMIVGDSGLTMKSPTMDAAISHAWKIERELRVNGGQALKDHAVELQIFEAQKAEYVKKRAKNESATMPQEPPPPVSERLIIGNATLEAISDVLLQQGAKGALVVADELLGFVAGANQYKGGKGSDRQDMLELFNGGPRAIDRKGRAVLIKNWGASVMGGTQPDAIARIGSNLEADGLLQRFSVYLPRYAHKGPDRTGDAAARRRYHEVLDRLVKMAARPDLAPVRFSPEASVIVDEARDWIFATARESWLTAGLRSHLAKWPAIFARFCLTYAAIEAADEGEPCIPASISDHIAAQVWRMMREVLWDHARHFYLMTLSGAGDKVALRQIAGLILSEGWLKISTRDMVQRSSMFRAAKAPEQRAIVAALCELGWLNPIGGRSAITGIPTKYAVNDAVHDRFAHIAERERAERGERAARWSEARTAKRQAGED